MVLDSQNNHKTKLQRTQKILSKFIEFAFNTKSDADQFVSTEYSINS